jgi:hypothetical protein
MVLPLLLLKVTTLTLVRKFLRTTPETSHDSYYYSTIGVSIPHERESQDPSQEHEATP